MSRYGSSDNPGKPEDESTRRVDYGRQGAESYNPPPIPAGPEYGPGEVPTHYANYPAPGQPAPRDEAQETVGFPAITEPGREPWFRRRSVLIGWFVLVAIMIALVLWGIVQLTSRGPERTPTPSTTSSTTTTTTPTTATTATTVEPPAAPPGEAPPHQPPPAEPPAIGPPHHRPHLPPIPSVITIPPIPRVPEIPTVITLPGR